MDCGVTTGYLATVAAAGNRLVAAAAAELFLSLSLSLSLLHSRPTDDRRRRLWLTHYSRTFSLSLSVTRLHGRGTFTLIHRCNRRRRRRERISGGKPHSENALPSFPPCRSMLISISASFETDFVPRAEQRVPHLGRSMV